MYVHAIYQSHPANVLPALPQLESSRAGKQVWPIEGAGFPRPKGVQPVGMRKAKEKTSENISKANTTCKTGVFILVLETKVWKKTSIYLEMEDDLN